MASVPLIAFQTDEALPQQTDMNAMYNSVLGIPLPKTESSKELPIEPNPVVPIN